MDTVFLLLLGISMLGILVSIIWAIINLILRKSAKMCFVSAGVSALVFVISVIGFGLTADDTAPNSSTSVMNEAPIATEDSALPDSVETITEQPTSEPIETPEDTPSTTDESEPTAENTLDFDVVFSDTYRNDVTGNWRLAKIAEDINIDEYAVDYYNNYFKSNSEVHIIINLL